MMSKVTATNLPFDEQINFFLKKLNLPTDSYLDLTGADHDNAFVVAGANRNEIIADFRKAVDNAINNGATLEEFRKDFDKIVKKHGWDYNGGRNWRSRIIYETNLYSSYQAGRYQQQMRIKHLRPYWQYRHRDGQQHPRPVHQSFDDLVLPYDDPFWQVYYPTNGYGCKCTVIAHSAKSLQKRGLKVSDSPEIEYEDKILGKRSGNPQEVRLPKGIDYGFDRIPSVSQALDPSKAILDKAIAVPPKLASNMVNHALGVPEIKTLLNAEVKTMVDRVFSEMIARKEYLSIGTLPVVALDNLIAQGITPQSAIITLRDEDILHSIRDSKTDQLPKDFWLNVVEHMANPEAILLDTNQNTDALIYIVDLGENKGKAIIKLDYKIQVKDDNGKKQKIQTNIIRSGKTFVYNENQRNSLNGFTLLYGTLEEVNAT